MKPSIRVASAPGKPLVIFDGDCNFCSLWVRRWEQESAGRVDTLVAQDGRVPAQFPELSPERLASAVHLVETDGVVYSGAEAVFRTLAHRERGAWVLDFYERHPVFAHASERCYAFVARHRHFFSWLTRLGWGQDLATPSHRLVQAVFLRWVGAVYFIAFVSLWVQIIGLIGNDGILPARLTLESVRQRAPSAHAGWERFHNLPTLCWLDASDGFLQAQCAAGTFLSLLVLAGLAPAPCLFGLWLLYLSLATVSREFLSFQWDALLLEIGFLAVFFSPGQLLPRRNRAREPSRLVLWLLRWLLFRIMFASGCVKLLSGDPAWRNLTALSYHYETQPLPTWLGWYVFQLPAAFQMVSTAVMFGIELVLPFLIFAPRRVRKVPFVAFIALQTLIFLTGNYCFFNLLTIALCVLLLDDSDLNRLWAAVTPRRKRPRESISRAQVQPGLARAQPSTASSPQRVLAWQWPGFVAVPLACVAIIIPLVDFAGLFGWKRSWSVPVAAIWNWAAPFRSLNSYGLFAVMTASRPEIIVQGSNDGVTWLDYQFKYKPGDVRRAPRFVEPHQPRLDWQMWFAALGDYRQNPWFINFCVRLLQGSPTVLALLERNPFPARPPRYVRAVVYDYHFTTLAARRQTGAWWQREEKREYLPVISLRAQQQQ
ncbi:MAG TPA: lipase maturation factor family protein [Candidatus Acidoferrum sp.]|nr:lipase maturation factor family protein [Candidatus Acidoferrum sp.]